MRNSRSLAVGVICVLGVVALLSWPAPSHAQAPAAPECKFYATNTRLAADLLVPAMPPPCAPAVGTSGPFLDPVDNLQHGFDLYSWLTFVALNSPVDGATPIGKGPPPGGDAPTVWESYRQLPNLMLEDGKDPPNWGDPIAIPAVCGGGVLKPGTMVIYMEEETYDQPFKSGPLIDQNGKYAVFVILTNKQMFQFIVDNKLYSRKGQADFPSAVNFPTGANGNVRLPLGVGAIMIKTSWKVLAGTDKPEEFHTINGMIYTPERKNPKVDATCVPNVKLGMIGFHVGHKGEFAPQWVWTTFEHVKNVPDHADAVAHRNLLSHYNFYDPTCDTVKCPANQTPERPWNPRVQPFPNGFKSQITRVIPVTKDVVQINALSQSVAGIKGTVWENYMLVSTQWPTDFANKVDLTGVPAPTYLPNATLETFSQGEVPLASSSCIACHLNATTRPSTTSKKEAVPSDFTYILEKAQ
jgi:hypothetical protein